MQILQLYSRREIATYLRGRIFRTVINHNDLVLVRWQSLGREALESRGEHGRAVEGRDYNTYGQMPRLVTWG